ncbi:MAG: energy transducer TonB [Gammaproteobacteria bacterium]
MTGRGGMRGFAIAASLALHAGVFALAWQPPSPLRTAPPALLQVTLLAPAPVAAAAEAAPSVPLVEAGDIATGSVSAATNPARDAGPPPDGLPEAPAVATETPEGRMADASTAHESSGTAASESDANAAPEALPSPARYTSGQVMASLKEAFSAHFYYPMLARRKGWEGEVTLALRVETDGRLTGIHVVGSSGHRVLDNAAVDSLSRARALRFPGGALGGSVDMLLPVHYRLLDVRV